MTCVHVNKKKKKFINDKNSDATVLNKILLTLARLETLNSNKID
jgi:hypothetical protein